MCHRFSFDYSVLWLFCLHNILPTNSSIFQRFCSAVSFLTVWAAKKNRSLLSFIFFFSLVDILAGTATVCSNSFVVVMYIYILSMASAVCPFGFYISLLVPFSFLLPYLSFFFFLYFLLLLLIFKKTKLSNYIYVFSSLILYT